ncbi:MAG: HEPN domain-containing protein [Pseudomonadota bacterium]
MIDREDSERMHRLARADLKAIRNMLDPEHFEDSVFGFHAQQAVEKALKAWLTLRGVAFPKTHDLRLLMNLLQTRTHEDCECFLELADLTDFAVQFRYDFPVLPHEIDRVKVISEVEDIMQHVAGLLENVDAAL